MNICKSQKICSEILDIFVIVFSIFTLYCNAVVLAGENFAFFVQCSYITFLFVIVFTILLRKYINKESAPNYINHTHVCLSDIIVNEKIVFSLLLSCVSSSFYIGLDNYFIFYLITLSSIFIFYFVLKNKDDIHITHNRFSYEGLILLILVVLASIITLAAHRPDQDDAFYLGTIVSILDKPDQPLLIFDGMYGENHLPFLSGIYRVHSYEILGAAISRLTGQSPLFVYYNLFPALFAGLVIITNYLAIKEVAGRWAVFGLLLTIIVFLTWGDGHRFYGNFSFVRLFQGKGILVSICVPALFYYGFRFVTMQRLQDWIMLGLIMVVTVGISSSGLVVAPLASLLILLAGWGPSAKRTQVFFKGLAAFVFLLLPVLIVLQGTADLPYGVDLHPNSAGLNYKIESINHDVLNQTVLSSVESITEEGLGKVIGNGTRAWISIFCLLLCINLSVRIGSRSGVVLRRYLVLLLLVIFNPFTVYFISKVLAGNFSWRIFWVAPIPLIMGLTGSLILARGHHSSRSTKVLGVFLYISLLAAFMISGPWTISRENRTELRAPSYKINPSQYSVAEFIVANTPEGGMMVAPWDISWILPLFSHHPRIFAVRQHYMGLLRFKFGEDEVKSRERMMQYITGVPGAETFAAEVEKLIEVKDISTIAFSTQLPWRNSFSEDLKLMGFSQYSREGYLVWVRQQGAS